MARYDSHLKRLEKKLRAVEAARMKGSITLALQQHAQDGTLPEHPGLRAEIIRINQVKEQMAATLPTTTTAKPEPGDRGGPRLPQENRLPEKTNQDIQRGEN